MLSHQLAYWSIIDECITGQDGQDNLARTPFVLPMLSAA
jgi:hypothetical protein